MTVFSMMVADVKTMVFLMITQITLARTKKSFRSCPTRRNSLRLSSYSNR